MLIPVAISHGLILFSRERKVGYYDRPSTPYVQGFQSRASHRPGVGARQFREVRVARFSRGSSTAFSEYDSYPAPLITIGMDYCPACLHFGVLHPTGHEDLCPAMVNTDLLPLTFHSGSHYPRLP